jgi:bifunctional DNA-binding transcriptional regulator/antitoxin component of YhaV-PrlF toxin-antitoxin module
VIRDEVLVSPVTQRTFATGQSLSYLHGIDAAEVVSMPDTATLSRTFQISIPKNVRTAHDWHAGQEFAFTPQGAGVLLVPVPKLEELRGTAKGANPEGYRDRSDRY